MRAFKFRAWEKSSETMVENVHEASRKRIIGESACESFDEVLDSWEYKVMQYTGLKDKNGVEIYEGDICSVYEVMDYGRGLEEKSYITDIKFDEGSFVVMSGEFGNYDTFLSGWFPGGGTRYPQIEFEVIGNIYENPNLLD